MKLLKKAPVLLIALALSSCGRGQEKNSKEQLTAIEFSERIKAGENIHVIDVRTPEEFKKGHVQNAINIDVSNKDFEQAVSKLDKTKPTYVYCLSGGRSASAADKMRRSGFKQVIEMPGGMMEWRSEDLPETRPAAVMNAGMTMARYQALLDTDKLVLVDLYADWCAPCKKMAPYLDKLAREMGDKVSVIRIDADANPELCKTMNVTALPVLKLYRNKEMIWEKSGFVEEQEVRKQLQ